MSRLFNRVVRTEIETDSELVEIGPLRTQFFCLKTRSDTPNELIVRLHNASQDTRLSGLASGATVRLFAGYEEPILVSQAQTTRAHVERTPPDTVLQLDCLDGINELRTVRVSLSFERGATARQVLDAIGDRLGRPIRPIEVELNVPLRGGYSHVGGVGTCLDDVCRRVGARWSIQNGDLMVLGPGGRNPGEAALLTPDSGLLYSPEPVEDALSSDNVGGEVRRGYRLTCLLQPQIEPGDQVAVESRDVEGVFVVDDIEHRGDTHGPEFYSTLTVYE